jgi:3-oxoacyl-[acyl-carrier protein] reductase
MNETPVKAERGAPKYSGSVVVITGARKGVGRLLAEYFLCEGASVVGMSRGETSITHTNYGHYSVDVGDDTAVRAAFVQIGRSHGRVDIVINNAAVLTSIHALLMPSLRAEEMVRTNVLGVLFAAREAAKLMKRRKFGRIINIGSMASSLEPVGDSVYAATKTAAMTLSAVLAKEFASYGITVNTLAVTAIETDMLDQLPREKVEAVVAGIPIPRFATPEDIFNVVDFFASPRSSYITAQTLFLGGVHA